MGFVVDKVALGRVFSEYFGFPCQLSFHQILHHHNHPGQAGLWGVEEISNPYREPNTDHLKI
jgi:hypothetical protein